MIAFAVIGANFGDEGKGLVTDYLCAKEGAEVVVRFNGGAQAGHTVVTPEGRRHVHHHFGSGTLLGVPTYLSEYFICNPILFIRELEELSDLRPQVWINPVCMVTTFVDMLINQSEEDVRGDTRHGSCGVGVYATICRDKRRPLRMRDLWDRPEYVVDFIFNECKLRKEDFKPSIFSRHVEEFLTACKIMAERTQPATMSTFKNADTVVFEGAQGLLLDMDKRMYYPHLTPSKTGLHNVRFLLRQLDKPNFLKAYYVSRTYMTRHGAGPLPNENPNMSYVDYTNTPHPYQGSLRFADLNVDSLLDRIIDDSRGDANRLVLTHCDQRMMYIDGCVRSFGPTREHVRFEA